MREYKSRLEEFLSNRWYMAAVLFTALLCYGFSATNITIGVDSMEGGRYLGAGNEMLASGRFGMKLWAMVMGYGDSGPAYSFCIAVLAAALLVLAAIHFSMIFRMVSGGKISLFGCGVFSCALISYPLMNEIWEYNGANLCVCGGYFLDAVSVYLAHIALNSPDINRRQKRMLLLAALLCMTVVSSGYESLAVVYVFLVFAQFSMHLIYDTQKNWNFSKILRQGLVYAAVLLLGIILRVLVHRLILLTLGIPAQTNGATEIFWAKMPVKHVLWELLWQCLFYYVAMAPSYFPIAELMAAVFLAAAVTAGLALKTRKPSLIVTCGGMFFCLVLLPIIQGKAAPYRCCQVFAVFAALTAMSLYEIARFVWNNRRLVLWLTQTALIFLCLYQATYLNHLLVLDHLRSEEEGHIFRTICTDLERSFDLDKTVVFLGDSSGKRSFSDDNSASLNDNGAFLWFREKNPLELDYSGLKSAVQTNLRSVLGWSVNAFSDRGSFGSSIEKLSRYYGTTLHAEHSPEIHAQASQYAIEKDVPGYPKDGYIVDWGDYIIVNLGQEVE